MKSGLDAKPLFLQVVILSKDCNFNPFNEQFSHILCGNLIWIRFDKSFESSLIIFCHKMGFNSKFRTYKIIKLVNWNFNIYKALKKKEYFFELHQNLTSFSQLPVVLCPIHLVTFTLISILVTDYIQKRRGIVS